MLLELVRSLFASRPVSRPIKLTIPSYHTTPLPVSPPVVPLPSRGGMGPKHDLIGLVGFHADAFTLVQPVSALNAKLQQAAQALPNQAVGTVTNLAAGLMQGVRLVAARPRNHRGRIYLLTDGYPNQGCDDIDSAVKAAGQVRANINTIGFGDSYDADLLKKIAAGTHRGRFIPVASLRQLTDVLMTQPAQGHREFVPETTILVLDLSASMNQPMEGVRKIDIVKEALLRVLAFKQQLFTRF